MTKRFCKMDRREIASQLGEIHQLVAAPKYLCRSCARASSSKSSLCKPQAIPSLKSKAKPMSVKAAALPEPIAEGQRPQTLLTAESVSAFDINLPSLGKKQLKQAKQALKKQRKYHKKLAKLAKKKVKQLQKREKLEGKLNKYNGILRVLSHKQVLQGSAEQVH
ncbi:hypothetical protein [Vibrio vulnificus]|uniref:hypothetical protein n=1 Tax=Vibrio vulnificus TaxID=672 RepID=UPI000D3ECC4F|nr:hypothetical protein [Vibrio vulnificus]MDT8805617.1 hypothetical protein [Vibrio vulnificus]PUZ97932.1 hypothetical protein DC364_06465 [Vibrio vulnificus]BDP28981.1 hypothetical protein VV208B2_00610 [Vibrio vulnificus]